MRKVAIFVEGLTEQLFVVRLITELLGSRGAHIQLGEQHRGAINYLPVSGTLPWNPPAIAPTIFVLVVDCRSDEQVKTQIREQYRSLVAAGYSSIIGLRDVYPLDRTDIPQVQAALNVALPRGLVAPTMHLAVMELEAWFLAQASHFGRIHPGLTTAAIAAGGFDLSRACDLWPHPAGTLDAIYKLAGCRYLKRDGSKTRRRIQRTVDALSYDELYVEQRKAVAALGSFIQCVETAIF